jgi:hypothetical protein
LFKGHIKKYNIKILMKKKHDGTWYHVGEEVVPSITTTSPAPGIVLYIMPAGALYSIHEQWLTNASTARPIGGRVVVGGPLGRVGKLSKLV